MPSPKALEAELRRLATLDTTSEYIRHRLTDAADKIVELSAAITAMALSTDGAAKVARDFQASMTVYYLESIGRNLTELSRSAEGPSIGSEVLADNRNWLDCYVDALRKANGMGPAL